MPKTIFCCLHFLLGFGYVAGYFSANALLVGRFGSDRLIQVYLGQGVLTLVLSALFYLLADRLPKKTFHALWFLFLGFTVLVAGFVLRAHPGRIEVFLLVRSLFDAVAFGASLGFWLAVGDHYSYRGAKRNYSGLMGAFILGDMAGGCLLQAASSRFPLAGFIFLWGLILAGTPVLLRAAGKARAGGEAVARPRGVKAGAGGETPPVLTALSLVLFLFWAGYSFLSDGTDYLFNLFASLRFRDEASLAAYFGQVAFLSNAAILLYHFLFSRAVYRRFGLDLAAFAIPVLIAGSWLLAHARPGLATMAVAQGLVYFFVDYLAATRLHIPLTVVSRKTRGRMKALTEGAGRAGGLLLLVYLAASGGLRPSFEEFSRVLLAAAVAFLAFPLLFRPVFYGHLFATLKSGNRALARNALRLLDERGLLRAPPAPPCEVPARQVRMKAGFAAR